jgi:hypothetical protein
MREEFQAIEWDEPPAGDLVEKAVAQGRRMRTARRVRIASAALAVVAVTGVATGVAIRGGGGTSAAPASVAAVVPSAPASAPAPAGPKRVKATPAGVLELLQKTLPDGKSSHLAGYNYSDGAVIVQQHLTRGGKTGVFELLVIDWKQPWAGTWTPLGNGVSYQVIKNPGNCIEPTIVLVRHPDNSLLQFNLSTCITDGEKKSPQILTVQEAAHIGADPRWGVTIDPEFNRQGAAHFPHLSKDFDK